MDCKYGVCGVSMKCEYRACIRIWSMDCEYAVRCEYGAGAWSVRMEYGL